ncbi:hypothetical protein [Enterobacter bugandensis]|uniref:hypothetical protein n=1 Tax=Enterobacter bugandensis TaxID=881260 RepID=UPI002FCEA673
MNKGFMLSALAATLFLPNAFADSLNIENPDGLDISVAHGSGAVTHSAEKRFYLDINPAGNNKITLTTDAIGFKKSLISSAAPGAGNRGGCNYSMIISKNFGWKLNSFGKNCSKSEDHYNPTQPAVYTIVNNSSHPIYVAFDEGNGFATDSIKGWLKPGQARMYDEHSEYWQHQGISYGKDIKTAIFDGQLNEYRECSSTFEPIKKNITYSYNSEHTCNIFKELTAKNSRVVAAWNFPLPREEFLRRVGATSSEGKVIIDLTNEKYDSLFRAPGKYSVPLKAGNSVITVTLEVIRDSRPPV